MKYKHVQSLESFQCDKCPKTFNNTLLFRNVVKNFENKWTHLQQKYGITSPTKVHIICENIPEYIESKGMAYVKEWTTTIHIQ